MKGGNQMEKVILTGRVFFEELDGFSDVDLDDENGLTLCNVLNDQQYNNKRIRITIEILED
jgi:hypothetical protein